MEITFDMAGILVDEKIVRQLNSELQLAGIPVLLVKLDHLLVHDLLRGQGSVLCLDPSQDRRVTIGCTDRVAQEADDVFSGLNSSNDDVDPEKPLS